MSGEVLMSRTALLASGVGLVAAGRAGATSSGSRAGLVWVIGGITSAGRGPAPDVMAQCNVLHPKGPRVRVGTLPQPTDEQRQMLPFELNAGLRNFDIVDLDEVWTVEIAQHRWLVNLNNLRPIIEGASLSGVVHGAMWSGTLWAAPYVTDAGILYDRSDLVDRPLASWDELIDIWRRVSDHNGVTPFPADGAQSGGPMVQHLECFGNHDGAVFDRDGQSVLFPLNNTQQAIKFMRSVFREDLCAPGFDTVRLEETRKIFPTGQAVFLCSWLYAYQQINGADKDSQVAEKVGAAALPAFLGHRSVTPLGGPNLAVRASSRNIPVATEFVSVVSCSKGVQRGPAQRYLPQWATIGAEMQRQIFTAYTSAREPKNALEKLRVVFEIIINSG